MSRRLLLISDTGVGQSGVNLGRDGKVQSLHGHKANALPTLFLKVLLVVNSNTLVYGR